MRNLGLTKGEKGGKGGSEVSEGGVLSYIDIDI